MFQFLVTFDGVIKIAGFAASHIHRGNAIDYGDEKAARLIMMQLIHKEQPMDDKIWISDHLRGEKLIDFLAQTELGSRADHLAKHPFLADSNGRPTWRASHLRDLLTDVAYSSQVNYIRG
ncbi:hypothetical protein G4B11_008725 [Aspergillus flavus]|nr:hypothetical protein G4B11_008725 [Aspergillus flavus]